LPISADRFFPKSFPLISAISS